LINLSFCFKKIGASVEKFFTSYDQEEGDGINGNCDDMQEANIAHEEPKVGMTFSSEEVTKYYKNYV
jgi:hypothetical protein